MYPRIEDGNFPDISISMFIGKFVNPFNIVEFLSCISDQNFEFYRGHADSSWELIPSIGRIKNPQYCNNIEFGSWRETEEYLIEEFQKQSIPFMDWEPKNNFDWLVQAQHHGLPTRLLDWTTNPLKALFFAVENHALNDIDGVVFGCDASYWSVTENVKDSDDFSFFHSGHLNPRIIAQEGCFSLSPISDLDFNSFTPIGDNSPKISRMEKIIIPKESKPIFRTELNRLGINHSSIYPGLDGITKKIVSGFSVK
ncbi:hypothetical protein GCM10011274_44260 [Paraglaciecola chathamensis]|uniref:FRG domain-containing protein n=1 Tax=Paraglaciecola chathamensis TaxID=368405 RepID=A0A8H9M345_9ALTE|nr:hypothetical protein GCM10011274_44260 [Paraglaciecola oceanifecundans]